MIKNANFLEVAVNRMADSEFSGNRRREILGELAYFKAFAYFRILCRYCEFWDEESEYGVVFRNEAPSVENAPMARSSVKDSYDYILSQLDIAVANTPQYTDLSKVNVKAAGALRAKVLFYAGRYDEAIRAVDDVVDTDAPWLRQAMAASLTTSAPLPRFISQECLTRTTPAARCAHRPSATAPRHKATGVRQSSLWIM